MSGNAHERMIELLDEAGQTYFKAMENGLQIQRDVTRWWSDQARTVPTNWSIDPQQTLAEAVKQWHANAEQALRTMEQRTQQSLDLLNKAFTVGQAGSIEAAQKKLNELWEASLKTMRDNVQATLAANEQMAAALMELVSKQTQQPAAKAAK